jgi:hypothetical protein
MTSWVVADSGVMLATVLNEPYTPQAEALLRAWSERDVGVAILDRKGHAAGSRVPVSGKESG